MKKTVRMISLASMIVLGISLLALLICIFAQVPLGTAIYGMDKAEIKENFAFPVGTFFGTLDYCIIALVLLLTAGKENKGILVELLCIGLIILACPAITSILNTVQTRMVGMLRGSEAMGVYSLVSSMCTVTQSLRGVAIGGCLVSCGMRIAMKRQK